VTPYSYQWYTDNIYSVPLVLDGLLQNRNFVFPTNDWTTYYLEVTDARGIKVRTNSIPTISIVIDIQPENKSFTYVYPILSVTFSITAHSTIGQPLTYQWINMVEIPGILGAYVIGSGFGNAPGVVAMGNDVSFGGSANNTLHTFACQISDPQGHSVISNTFTYYKICNSCK
jgi:hypothetical protein